uniref:Uncharacterized protein n=1 Tax=Aureoumbra lagunensis TaxID=44058 RepID=A0A7S3JS65_9STRA|mmetsp:Transcript_22026/g.33995  ORF Transcript_22026/g.33995 Transcript_22026/m.33995 type:complete len:291 (-) Transcript_22026:18-890(-)
MRRLLTALVLQLQRDINDGHVYYDGGENNKLLLDSGCPRSIVDDKEFSDDVIGPILFSGCTDRIRQIPATVRERGYTGILGWDFIKALGKEYANIFFDLSNRSNMALRLSNENSPSVLSSIYIQELEFSPQARYPILCCSLYALGACEDAVGLLDLASPISMCNTPAEDMVRLFPRQDNYVQRTTTGVDGRTSTLRAGQAAGIRLGSSFDIPNVPLAIADTPAMDQLGFRNDPFLLIGLDLLGDSFALHFLPNVGAKKEERKLLLTKRHGKKISGVVAILNVHSSSHRKT